MIGVQFHRELRGVTCIGAHPDDIEVGAAGLISSLADTNPDARFLFVVAAGDDRREDEAQASAHALLGDRVKVVFGHMADGMLPYAHLAEAKQFVRQAESMIDADLVIAPHIGDRHQDHRFVAELAHQVFRRQMILEYEIVKLEGDLLSPAIYHPMTADGAQAKLDHLARHFPSQQDKAWYHHETFAGLMRIRGVECLAPDGYAEAFHANRVSLT